MSMYASALSGPNWLYLFYCSSLVFPAALLWFVGFQLHLTSQSKWFFINAWIPYKETEIVLNNSNTRSKANSFSLPYWGFIFIWDSSELQDLTILISFAVPFGGHFLALGMWLNLFNSCSSMIGFIVLTFMFVLFVCNNTSLDINWLPYCI